MTPAEPLKTTGSTGCRKYLSVGSEEKHIKQNPHKKFQRESGRGSGREVSGSECFMLVSFFLHKIQHIVNIEEGGVLGFRGGSLRSDFGGRFFMFMCFFGT